MKPTDRDNKRGDEIFRLQQKLADVEVNYFRTCYWHRYESAPEEQQENWKFEAEDYEYRKSLIEDELKPLYFLEEFRHDSDVGSGTCSEWDECYTDEELLEWCRHNDIAWDQAIEEAKRIEKLRKDARECRLRGAGYEGDF